jgi:hypothetical protein
MRRRFKRSEPYNEQDTNTSLQHRARIPRITDELAQDYHERDSTDNTVASEENDHLDAIQLNNAPVFRDEAPAQDYNGYDSTDDGDEDDIDEAVLLNMARAEVLQIDNRDDINPSQEHSDSDSETSASGESDRSESEYADNVVNIEVGKFVSTAPTANRESAYWPFSNWTETAAVTSSSNQLTSRSVYETFRWITQQPQFRPEDLPTWADLQKLSNAMPQLPTRSAVLTTSAGTAVRVPYLRLLDVLASFLNNPKLLPYMHFWPRFNERKEDYYDSDLLRRNCLFGVEQLRVRDTTYRIGDFAIVQVEDEGEFVVLIIGIAVESFSFADQLRPQLSDVVCEVRYCYSYVVVVTCHSV